MKRNPKDEYRASDEDMFIEDEMTNEKLLFLIDRENRIVIRSFLEEDIKTFVQNFDGSAKEKREKKRILYDSIPQEGSQMYFFAIEKIIGQEDERWDSIYGLERIPIGLGARTEDEYVSINKKVGPSIEAYLYTKEESMTYNVSKMIEKIAEYFNIKGTSQILPCK